MKNHQLKTDPYVFDSVWNNNKNFEIRKNDRDFRCGDLLILSETVFSGEEIAAGKPLELTGRVMTATVKYVLYGPQYGLIDGWCIMSIDNVIRYDSKNECN